LVPTKLGIALVHAYQKVDPDLVSPTIRADMEKQLDLIAKGKANGEMVNSKLNHTYFLNILINFKIKKEILKDYKQKLENLIENIGLMDEVIDELKANEMRNYKPPSQFDGTGGSRKRRHSFD
jgi:DNA topoisomerase IA